VSGSYQRERQHRKSGSGGIGLDASDIDRNRSPLAVSNADIHHVAIGREEVDHPLRQPSSERSVI
jgi:hypothetical protein